MNKEETIGNDNVCEAISSWQGPQHPWGRLGSTKLQPQGSVLPLSVMTLPSHFIAKCVDNTYLQ